MSTNFIDLGRTFYELPDEASNTDDADISQLFRHGNQLGWQELINEHRLIILAEAGSGKTTEIKHLAQRLRADGKAAFFLRLEDILRAMDFNDVFEVGTEAEFNTWMAGSEEGWLFLDSIDEARLKNHSDFQFAIKILGKKISLVKERLHIVITGRTTAWRPITDLDHCRQNLPYTLSTQTQQVQQEPAPDVPEKQKTKIRQESHKSTGFKIVTLADLNEEQVKCFVTARGLTDVKAFLNAVKRADAWTFTTRPQDLEELTEFWLENGRIGNRLEIIRNSIDRRLDERDQGRASDGSLSRERIREGARLLAAATTLSKNQTIRVPDGADNFKGIPVQDVLTDWTPVEQSTLLSRPIFDEAIYGTVRFHHRSVREYLTAEWFHQLLQRDTSRRAIEGLFFRQQYGTTIVAPMLRPVLSWLCIWDLKIRARVLAIAPELALEDGDPSQWPLEERRRILRDVCRHIAEGAYSRSTRDHSAVKRFANADIADDVRDLLHEHTSHDEVRTFLLSMVWHGELKEILPEVMAVALSPEAQHYPRVMAFRALTAVGPPEDQRAVRNSFIQEAPELNRSLFAELIESQQPDAETIEWLVAGLEKCPATEEFSDDDLSYQVLQFVEKTPEELLSLLVVAFDRLLSRPPLIEHPYYEVSKQFEWLLKSAARVVERLVLSRHPAALFPPCLSLLRKLACAHAYQSREWSARKSDLMETVPTWPELNRSLFWFEVESDRTQLEEKGERLTECWRVSVMGRLWSFKENDFGYLLEQITFQPMLDNQLVALSLAFSIYRNHGRLHSWRKQLKKLTAGNEVLSNKLALFFRPPVQPEERHWKAQNLKWKKRAKAQQIKMEHELDKARSYLSKNLETLRTKITGEPDQLFKPLCYLYPGLTQQSRDTVGIRFYPGGIVGESDSVRLAPLAWDTVF